MAAWVRSRSNTTKVVVVIIILGFAGLAWWLASPLFLSGPSANQMIDNNGLTLISRGNLTSFNKAHYGMGMIELYEAGNGSLVIYFHNVTIANGPDLLVYVSSKQNFSGIYDQRGNYVSFGSLPATRGNFSMQTASTVPFDIASVVVWCRSFRVLFTYATMT